MEPRNRTLPLVALALAVSTTLIGPAGPAGAAEVATATLGEVTCVETDGRITVTLAASDTDPATFVVIVGEFAEEVTLAAGETQDVVTSGLEDGDVGVQATLQPDEGEEEGETLLTETVPVACDVAPEGPYTNPAGMVQDTCEGTAWMSASNKPIAGNTDDLQPVTFRVTFTPTDDPVIETPDGEDTGGGEEPGSDGEPTEGGRVAAGPEFELATFVLDADTPSYARSFSAEELGSTGDLTLWVGEEIIARAHVGYCVVVAVEDSAGGGPELVNTGA